MSWQAQQMLSCLYFSEARKYFRIARSITTQVATRSEKVSVCTRCPRFAASSAGTMISNCLSLLVNNSFLEGWYLSCSRRAAFLEAVAIVKTVSVSTYSRERITSPYDITTILEPANYLIEYPSLRFESRDVSEFYTRCVRVEGRRG